MDHLIQYRKTTSIVVGMVPGYTLNPKQIKFLGAIVNQWITQLPNPEVDRVDSYSKNVDEHKASASPTNAYNVSPDSKPRYPKTSDHSQRTTQIGSLQVTGDYFVNLPERVDMAQRDHAEVCVGVYANSADKDCPDVNGLEVYYYDSGLDSAGAVRHKILTKCQL
ncbi:hypothetical protein G7B40_028345 [Aetokthonos hydrillicola Thurmond2011]|jgi:hypothetical protein|uniref:Uncharacterized protein n=1 Tax=Aetokthonos hydrillicola Thurmond2011 TaxID=2712845 RepID=A0AAP5IG46_9CYAN|nr:hypothetical protein [Aetokthonos hydrillicola]MBO3458133.1 hypothetical protein [Aetokthonos hydrillicola CCALA 1050]MBW4584353.1 hypothetical protein [Aetokthonos hydrillicola CCALA 1050]MDR9898440.1 hypothetical protein [Aetokthonos hydrillicola Thurmond2011]